MYEAKRRGDTIAVYEAESDRSSPERLGLLADLRRALIHPNHTDEITFHYQPQIAVATGEMVGVEALVRWQHPDRGMVSPDELVRAAEHSSVMRLLTFRAIDDVIAQLGCWRAQGHVLTASINVSARDLHTSDIVDHIAAQLHRAGIDAQQIRVEITETALMADPQRVLRTVRQLSELGVTVSLDDFGTGYSSLLHLRRFPLAEVKIDQSFVRRMAEDPYDAAIVRSIIEPSPGLRVVAEGVEDDATSRLLAEAGCEVAQGWYYGHPVPADRLLPDMSDPHTAA
jgi:EAL domain-containing protein (putative c-di-GMP-specific phosphodiesterase class I)